MLKDKVFKLSCVVAFGFIQCYRSLSYLDWSLFPLLAATAFFIAAGYLVIYGSVKIQSHARQLSSSENVFIRLGLSVIAAVLFSSVIVILSQLLCQAVFAWAFVPHVTFDAVVAASVLVIFYTLVYEILFLNKERELDNKVVKQLDTELMQAEVNFLKNEMDPHFVYNCLMPLYYLIKNNVAQAESFTYKLMQVYQHFLQNRKKDFIPLGEELKFIENYFYLLQIRFKDALSLRLEGETDLTQFAVIPFTIQLLVENAIKHTRFDSNEPLEVALSVQNNFLVVSNRISYAPEGVYSSKAGLQNLRMRYKYLMNRNIYVYRDQDSFIVKVPLQRKLTKHDVSRRYRG
jgi:two-component system, LytTR family, sensor kinase